MVARLRLGLGDYREADALLEQQTSLLDDLPDAPASLRLEAATLRGNVHRQLGDVAACTARMKPQEALAVKEEQRLPSQAAAFYSQLGRCHRELEELDAANRLFLRALQLRRARDDNAGVAETMLDLATIEADSGNPRKAIRVLEDALEQLRRSGGERHPLAIDIQRSLCSLERAVDDLLAAGRHCRASLELAQALRGRNHRATVDANRQLAAIYVDMGRFAEAESIFLEAFAWMRTRLDPKHPDMARAYNSLAIVAWERGEIEQALRYQRQAVAGWRDNGNAGLLSGGLFNMALILHSDGRDREALPLLQESGALRVKQYGAEHSLVGDNDRLRGEVLQALGRNDEARKALESAVRLTEQGFGKAHSHTRRAEISLARFRARNGASEAAAQLQAFGQAKADDTEQRKATWLARAYHAQLLCKQESREARIQLEGVLAEMQLAFPEGGSIAREIQRIRDACGRE